jgi:hypothetical protein
MAKIKIRKRKRKNKNKNKRKKIMIKIKKRKNRISMEIHQKYLREWKIVCKKKMQVLFQIVVQLYREKQ